MLLRRPALLPLTIAALWLVPNEPHPAWYALPEIACDLVHSDEDQWLCERPAVAWEPGQVRVDRY